MRHYLYFNTVLYFAFVKDSINNPCPIIIIIITIIIIIIIIIIIYLLFYFFVK